MSSNQRTVVLLLILLSILLAQNIICDADSDCFYIPQKIKKLNKLAPALIYLDCGGATKKNLDSLRIIGDSLQWILATCHRSRNHRNWILNDQDIVKTHQKLVKNYQVDTSRIFIYGFSGMGVQALLELFLHPELFRGAIAVCAHSGAIGLTRLENLKENLIYLISREKDWNLSENLKMHREFQNYRIQDTLVITPGEHSIGDKFELLNACIWLDKNSR
ncbi:MAG: prolyl oligopeptidase family serine peptidase [candidate division WOR-3 bacterium]